MSSYGFEAIFHIHDISEEITKDFEFPQEKKYFSQFRDLNLRKGLGQSRDLKIDNIFSRI